MTAKKAATSAKHATATVKHAATKKHTSTESAKTRSAAAKKGAATKKAEKAKVTAKAKAATPAKAAKAVSFGIGDHLPVCSFEAVAMSLRLAGQRVHDDEVAELWHLLGERPEGVPVGEALAAAALFGLAGCRPASVRWTEAPFVARTLAPPFGEALGLHALQLLPEFGRGAAKPGGQLRGGEPCAVARPVGGDQLTDSRRAHALILHVDMPGPHAVLATADGWWSWGELYSPWPAQVSEAWAVSWS